MALVSLRDTATYEQTSQIIHTFFAHLKTHTHTHTHTPIRKCHFDAIYRKIYGPVNKVEEHFLHGINGTQIWNNGFNNTFCSSNVFIFHSSSSGGQFYAALPSTRSACKSMSIRLDLSVHVLLDPFSINAASAQTLASLTDCRSKTAPLQCTVSVHSRRLLQADAHYGDTLTSSDFTIHW